MSDGAGLGGAYFVAIIGCVLGIVGILFGIGMVWILVSAIKINLKVQDIDWIGGILAIVPGWFLAGLIFNLLMSWFT